MADNPIENYAAKTDPDNLDVYAIIDDPDGTPTTEKITHRNVQKVVLTKDEWIYPHDMIPFVTNGAALGAVRDLSTNVALRTMDFAAAADDSVSFISHPPEEWDALTVTFSLVWTNQSGIAAELMDFDLSGRSFADADALDQAMGTVQLVTDTWSAQDDNQKTPFSPAITLAGSPANGTTNIFKLTMDTGTSTLTGNCEIIALILRYGTVNQGST